MIELTLNKLKVLVNKIKKKELRDFFTSLFREVPCYDLESVEDELLVEGATKAYEFAQKRKTHETKVDIFKSSKNADTYVIQILNRDIPFLIDSLTNELKHQQLQISLIVHPTLLIKRDNKGQFISIGQDGHKEALIQFYLSNFNEKDIAALRLRFYDILECINASVDDWRIVTAKMLEGIDLIKDSSLIDSFELRNESISFLEWLINNHFVFLGSIECKIKGNELLPIDGTAFGVAKSKLYKFQSIPIDDQFESYDPVFIHKWDSRSVVHRTAHMDWITIKKLNSQGKCIGAMFFFGLFTSTVYYQSVRNIPLVRKKISDIIKRYGYPENSHNGKELITVLEQFPRGELLQMSTDELYDTATSIVSLSLIPRLKLFVRNDKTGRFASCIVFIPEKKFSTETRNIIESIICKHIKGTVSKRYVQIGESSLVRLQLMIKTDSKDFKQIDVNKIESEISKAISIWSDDLLHSLASRFSKNECFDIYQKFKNAFDVRYKSVFSANKAIHDILLIEKTLKENKVKFDLYISHAGATKEFTQLKIYSPDKELPLSSTLPVIENLGLFAEDMFTYEVTFPSLDEKEPKKVFIHHFRLRNKCESLSPDLTKTLEKIVEALDLIWSQMIDDDPFNSLILACGINAREAMMLRAYSKYLRQTDYPVSVDFTIETLLNYKQISKNLVELFNLKFTPDKKQNEQAIQNKIKQTQAMLFDIKSVIEDKVIRSLLNVITATKRTNYFQKLDGEFKDYLSLKISSKEVEDLPQPKPFAEIYVYSAKFEAVHLRGGKVARGGLRWSDRKEDYRTEVLGLMKAQMTKNSVIVPVGSKGGFVIRKQFNADNREEYFKEGVKCYKTFLSGLLDVTDNIIGGKIVHPKGVVIHDNDDPYLVVAADKGTATFSDYANEVSIRYGFWLGDAFASGGSVGYDHKKMGITAKGGWISVVRHFAEMGMDINKQTFTCIGIGDMAGDVFGNGMLLSNNMKLIAAFNHMHIFLDPNPDPKISFEERKRLFNLPRSSWADYNPNLISKGGGIFERKAKTIPLSTEIRQVLDIESSELNPDALIKAILQAPADLLWNGGIGTYVKCKTESNEKIGDKANDALRINGSELRCKLVGEGGNLGFTQLGRIEYAKVGGRINTDAIDNSAGVDCSDHEVNIKIAMSDSIRSGKLKMADRNALLSKMTNEVADLVLADNFKQTQIISLETQSKNSRTSSHDWLIRKLESAGELDRSIEFLPNADDLKLIIADRKRLTRPEVSVILAYAKNSAFSMACKYDLTKEPFFKKYLHSYFPAEFRKKSPDLIDGHKLKNEILGTVLVNELINVLGCTFFHQVLEDMGATAEEVVKAYVLIKEVFGLDKLWHNVERLPASTPLSLKLGLFNEIQSLFERNITWILSHQRDLSNLEKTYNMLHGKVSQLILNAQKISTPGMLEEMSVSLIEYKSDKDAYGVAKEIMHTKLMLPALDIIKIATTINKESLSVAKIFFEIGEKLSLIWILTQVKSFVPRQYFQLMALRVLISEIQNVHMSITASELVTKKTKASKIDSKNKIDSYNSFINDLKSGEAADVFISKLTIMLKKVREIYE